MWYISYMVRRRTIPDWTDVLWALFALALSLMLWRTIGW